MFFFGVAPTLSFFEPAVFAGDGAATVAGDGEAATLESDMILKPETACREVQMKMPERNDDSDTLEPE